MIKKQTISDWWPASLPKSCRPPAFLWVIKYNPWWKKALRKYRKKTLDSEKIPWTNI